MQRRAWWRDGSLPGGRSTRSERAWARAPLLEGRPAGPEPAQVSDGAGLAFAPAALFSPAGALDPEDPAVGALAALLDRRTPAEASSEGPSRSRLAEWRVLARTEDEVLFAYGLPPELTTVAMAQEGRRGSWSSLAVTRAPTLRATRDGVRASGWELEDSHPLGPGDTEIRIWVTEQTRSGGALATRRLLAPDVHESAEEIRITMFITPVLGVRIASSVPRTPVRLRLPSPVGDRWLVDGALHAPD